MMQLKIRPFDETGKAEIKRISGEISEGKFVLTLDAASYEIPVLEVLEDQRGLYAIVDEDVIELGFEYYIKIEAEYDVNEAVQGSPGCAISFEKRNDSIKLKEALIDQAMNIDSVNLLNRTSQPFMTVYFGPSGIKNGTGYPLSTHKEENVITI